MLLQGVRQVEDGVAGGRVMVSSGPKNVLQCVHGRFVAGLAVVLQPCLRLIGSYRITRLGVDAVGLPSCDCGCAALSLSVRQLGLNPKGDYITR